MIEVEIIVLGGCGFGELEKFVIFEFFVEKFGVVVGVLSAVVDAGWRSHSDQVGQTGKTVSPKLYIVVGILGAI